MTKPKSLCMKKINIVSFIFYTLLIFSCKSRTDQERKNETIPPSDSTVIIDIERDFKKEKEFRLSEIADDIQYVKLEKTPASLVGGGIPLWYITKAYIFVYSSSRLLQFYRNGKFIRHIGSGGRGPGEYLGIRGIVLNELNNTIYVKTNYSSKVLKYNVITGEFLGDFPVNSDLGSSMVSGSFQIIDKDIFIELSHPMTQFDSAYAIFEIFNHRGEVLVRKKSSLFSIQVDNKNRERKETGFTQIWYYDGNLRLFEDLNDTIYNIKYDQLQPVYIFHLGKYKGSFEEMTTNHVINTMNFIRLFGFWETPTFIFFHFSYNGEFRTGRFDKINKEFSQLIQTSDQSNNMINDIDGGIPFWPYYPVEQIDDEWIYCLDAIDLKQQLTTEWLVNSNAKYPEKKEQLKLFLDKLTNDDNPVIMTVKLKD